MNIGERAWRRLRTSLLLVFLFVSFFGFTGQSSAVNAQELPEVTPSNACAITPELLAGQGGYAVAGLGAYAVTGLGGYAVAGLRAYAVSGLGGYALAGLRAYAVTGLNDLSPEERELLITEIETNQISPDWIKGFLPDLTASEEFNTVRVAVLIVDDFDDVRVGEHGELVSEIFVDLKVAIQDWLVENSEFTNVTIDFYPVDISVGGSYQIDVIADNIENTVQYLHESLEVPYNHFVLNMSFGLLPCVDEELGFSFDNYLVAREEAQGPQAVRPVLECVTDHGNGTYTAHFGYLNENSDPVYIPISDNNKFNPAPQNKYQVTIFQSGRHQDVFRVDFYGGNQVWTLQGPDGSRRTSTASPSSTPCNPYSQAEQPVIPILDCVAENAGGDFTAYFGYENQNEVKVRVPMGEQNRFTPSPNQDYGQIRVFEPGRQQNTFAVDFTSGVIYWTVEGPDHVRRTAMADSNNLSQRCLDYPEFEEYGLIEYLEDQNVDPGSYLDDLFSKLAESPEELADLQLLLQQYLADSANPEDPFSLIALASSGNYATLLNPDTGIAPPLYPAAFDETISVGASYGGDTTIRWQGSHQGNVMAPGAWYEFDDSFFGAGTSYSAPHASMVAALYLTLPDACVFTPTLPPLRNFAIPLSNAPFVAGQTLPLNCSINQSPIVMNDSAQTTYQTSVNIDVLGNDIDPDEDSLSIVNIVQPDNGFVSFGEGNEITYTPNETFPGEPGSVQVDTFTYEVSDGSNTVSGSVSVEVVRLQLIANCPPGAFEIINNGSFPIDYTWDASTITETGNIPTTGNGTVAANSTSAFDINLYERIVDISVSGALNDSQATLNGIDCGPSVTGFVLLDAHNDVDLFPITDGATINIAELSTNRLSVRAVTDPQDIGSVVFDLNDHLNYRTENEFPYSLQGDTEGNYQRWSYDLDVLYTITATPYSEDNSHGYAGIPSMITFTFVDDPELQSLQLTSICPKGEFRVTNPNDTDIDFIWDVYGTDILGNGTVEANSEAFFNTGLDSGTVRLFVQEEQVDVKATIDNCTPALTDFPGDQVNDEGDTVELFINATDTDTEDILIFSAYNLPSGVTIDPVTGTISGTAAPEGTYQIEITVTDSVGATDTESFTWIINANVDLPSITALILVDADSDTDVITVTNDFIFNFADYPEVSDISLRAATDSTEIGSVVFGVDDNNRYRVENVAPYALQGDTNGNYRPFRINLNVPYMITATPYTERNGRGTAGTPTQVTITFVDNEAEYISLVVTPTCPRGNFEIVNANDYAVPFGWRINNNEGGDYNIPGNVMLPVNSGDADSILEIIIDDVPTTYRAVDAYCPPIITVAVPNQVHQIGDVIEGIIAQGYGNGPAVSIVYSANNLPSGLIINETTGVISGVVAEYAAGQYNVEIVLTDDFGAMAVTNFIWYVTPGDVSTLEEPLGADTNGTGSRAGEQ